jgi:hypothetical protein
MEALIGGDELTFAEIHKATHSRFFQSEVSINQRNHSIPPLSSCIGKRSFTSWFENSTVPRPRDDQTRRIELPLDTSFHEIQEFGEIGSLYELRFSPGTNLPRFHGFSECHWLAKVEIPPMVQMILIWVCHSCRSLSSPLTEALETHFPAFPPACPF